MNAIPVASGELSDFLRAGPGAFLRSVREDRGWDLAYVSASLHLSADSIAALEDNDFSRLPDEVFVQGYLRKYARLLEQPVEPLLRAYADACPNNKTEQRLHVLSQPEEIRSSHAAVRSVSFLVIGAVLVLSLLWWAGYLQHAQPDLVQRMIGLFDSEQWTDSDPGAEASGLAAEEGDSSIGYQPSPRTETSVVDERAPQASSDQGASNAPVTDAAAMEAESAAAESAPDAEVVASPASEDSGSAPPSAVKPAELPERVVERETIQPLVSASPVTATSSESMVAGEASEAANAEAAPSTMTETTQAATEAQARPAEQQAPDSAASTAREGFLIELKMNGESWVNLRDANGRNMVVGTLGKGESRRISSGTPPFSLVLGRAQAVSLRINEQSVELAPHTRKEVAKLEINRAMLGLDP